MHDPSTGGFMAGEVMVVGGECKPVKPSRFADVPVGWTFCLSVFRDGKITVDESVVYQKTSDTIAKDVRSWRSLPFGGNIAVGCINKPKGVPSMPPPVPGGSAYKFATDVIARVEKNTALADWFRDQLKAKVTVATLVTGGNFLILCPFHSDNRASCTVSSKNGDFICHRCGTRGSWNKLAAKMGMSERWPDMKLNECQIVSNPSITIHSTMTKGKP